MARKLNTTKSGITVMFSGTASGTLLPPYVMYKSENMWDTWRQGGPKGSSFNRSQSGWFEIYLKTGFIKLLCLI